MRVIIDDPDDPRTLKQLNAMGQEINILEKYFCNEKNSDYVMAGYERAVKKKKNNSNYKKVMKAAVERRKKGERRERERSWRAYNKESTEIKKKNYERTSRDD